MEIGALGMMPVNVVKHVEKVPRDKFDYVILLHLNLVELLVVSKVEVEEMLFVI